MSFFRKSKKLDSNTNILELTPFHIYSHEVEENGLVSVLIPRFHNKFLANTLSPRLKDPYVRVKFDEFGSSAWLEIDGNKKVKAIADRLIEIHGEKIQPANQRAAKFLNQLYLYKFINFNEMKGEE